MKKETDTWTYVEIRKSTLEKLKKYCKLKDIAINEFLDYLATSFLDMASEINKDAKEKQCEEGLN